MNTRTPVISRTFLILALMLTVLPLAALAQPVLSAFSFTPTSIDTGAVPVNVTVNFSANDSSPISYFEMAFIDPTGVFVQRGFKSLTPATSVIDSVTVAFPRFSVAGTWKVLAVFLSDTSGNTLLLDTAGLAGGSFPTDLQVASSVDSTPPAITSFSFSPAAINTTSAAQSVTVNFTATDDLAGVASVYAGFVGPSGAIVRGTRVNAPADFTSGPSVTGSFVISFPQQSEPGVWTVSGINVVDGAGNTLFLDPAGVANQFPGATSLTVSTTADTAPPSLTSFSFSPGAITTDGGPVMVNFTVADDFSGVDDFEVAFLSPTGTQTQTQSGRVSFAPATSFSGAVTVNFPSGTEMGTWTTAAIFLADAAGNTTTINQPITLTVNMPGADTTPPVITPVASPLPNSAGWNNTLPVNLTWNVSDPESGIASQTGCNPSTYNAPTTGTAVTCMATNGAGLSNSVTYAVRIDTAPPITSNLLVTPNPAIAGQNINITATVTDAGGSNVASAEFNIDGGPFDDLLATDGSFGGSSENVSQSVALAVAGTHTICVRGVDRADNVGATQCAMVTASPSVVFIGLKNSDDQGTNFDVLVEMLKNGSVVASGLTRCVTGVTRNPSQAKQVSVPFTTSSSLSVITGDVITLRVSTRIGTNANDTACGGHSNAVGLTLYYDSTDRPSRFNATILPDVARDLYLHTSGTSDSFNSSAPTGTTAKSKDSPAIKFAQGNVYQVVGAWSVTQP